MLNFEPTIITDFESAYHNVNRLLENEQANHLHTISFYKEMIRYLQKQLYGPSADKVADPNFLVFNEPELEADEPTTSTEDDDSSDVSGHKRKKAKRKPLPEYLPRKEIIYDLSSEEKQCSSCNLEMKKIGEETSEQLEIIPAKIEVLRHIRFKYACPCCDGSIKKASMPEQAIPKSIAGPGLLSHLIISKYQDGLPLYRQELILKRALASTFRGASCPPGL